MKTIFHSFAALIREILFYPLEDKIHIFALPCNILYLFYKHQCYIEFLATEKNRILTHVKNTIFLRVKISFLQANQKPRRKFVWPIRKHVVKRKQNVFLQNIFYQHGKKIREYYRRRRRRLYEFVMILCTVSVRFSFTRFIYIHFCTLICL